LKATGGSGNYKWSIDKNEVAKVDNSILYSFNIGETTLTLRDERILNNFATILVEVKPVNALTWLESRIEIENSKGIALLSTIARDSQGRKYTNCSGIKVNF
jgi:hypothetical protein